MISTHILDTTLGCPAKNVSVTLEKMNGQGAWAHIANDTTNIDGRIVFNNSTDVGTYRLTFAVEDYFKKDSRECFFTSVPVIFKITDSTRKYHVPLLLNPYSFSTYRGS